jgi:hypothetical protein
VSVVDYHIEQFRRREGWPVVVVTEMIWTSAEWITEPKKKVGAYFLIVEFHSWNHASSTPDGNWQFSGSTNSMVEYNRGNTPLKPGPDAAQVILHSDRITLHHDTLSYVIQQVEPTAYSFLKIIVLQRG